MSSDPSASKPLATLDQLSKLENKLRGGLPTQTSLSLILKDLDRYRFDGMLVDIAGAACEGFLCSVSEESEQFLSAMDSEYSDFSACVADACARLVDSARGDEGLSRCSAVMLNLAGGAHIDATRVSALATKLLSRDWPGVAEELVVPLFGRLQNPPSSLAAAATAALTRRSEFAATEIAKLKTLSLEAGRRFIADGAVEEGLRREAETLKAGLLRWARWAEEAELLVSPGAEWKNVGDLAAEVSLPSESEGPVPLECYESRGEAAFYFHGVEFKETVSNGEKVVDLKKGLARVTLACGSCDSAIIAKDIATSILNHSDAKQRKTLVGVGL